MFGYAKGLTISEVSRKIVGDAPCCLSPLPIRGAFSELDHIHHKNSRACLVEECRLVPVVGARLSPKPRLFILQIQIDDPTKGNRQPNQRISQDRPPAFTHQLET